MLPHRRLSAGQRRRIGLARLMLDPAPVWILDEPLTALDDEGQALFARTLARHLERGGLALVRDAPRPWPPPRPRREASRMNCPAHAPELGPIGRIVRRGLRVGVRTRPHARHASPGRDAARDRILRARASLFPLGVGAEPQLAVASARA
jgi:hypothetical protein